MASLAIVADMPAENGAGASGCNDLHRTLTAVQRLAGAAHAHILAYDDLSGVATVVESTAVDHRIVSAVAARAASEVQATTMLNDVASRWMNDSDGGDGQALLVKISGRLSDGVFLLLCLNDASPLARTRLVRSVPDLLVLVRSHISLGQRLREAEEVRDAAREALDHGECGVITIRADHSVVFANAAGTRHLASGGGLRVRRGVLRPVHHAQAIRFEAALDSVIDGGETRAKPRASIMLLGDGEGDRQTIVVIAPSLAAQEAAERMRGAAAMIYILPVVQGAASGLAALCQLHGLSRVETSLIVHLMEGLTLTEAAGRMRIKIDTARTYLKQIFAKTGLHRQAELVALMTRYLRAVRGDFDFRPA